MFTRKHYRAIAEILDSFGRQPVDGDIDTYQNDHEEFHFLVKQFAGYFAADNERFNKQQFYNACGLEYKGQ